MAGFFSYEAGYAFEESFCGEKKFGFPLVYFAAYAAPRLNRPIQNAAASSFSLIENGISKSDYQNNIRTIKNYLANGDSYQVNYAFKKRYKFIGNGYDIYQKLTESHPVPFSAYLKTPNFTILSLSPELFFRKSSNQIIMRPMKGTLPIDQNPKMLRQDEKNQAENLMIVDLLRNDLGKISITGTVAVDKLFEIEKYSSLYQMTSTITSKLIPGLSFYQLFKSLFPSGSVTGAPKLRTMRIIRQLEPEERKIYTGSIGYFSPNGDAIFNVAIRTILLEGQIGELGIGSGVTFASDSKEEYEECLLKSRFMEERTKRKKN